MWKRALLVSAAILGCAGDRPITVHLAGDSTMAPKTAEKRPETGWGEMLQARFDSQDVRIVNHARNGRSTRTFISEGRWDAIVRSLRRGDVVLIQFGHNDAVKEKVDRYTPPADYRANLVRFVSETRAKGATPVLLTPVVRRRFDASGQLVDAHGEYPDIVRAVAAEHDVLLFDMHRASAGVLREHGPERSRQLFLHLAAGEHPNYPGGLKDDTHFSPYGAQVMAELFLEELSALSGDLARRMRPSSPRHQPPEAMP
jgi:lysophospholipase L1-like esterase